MLKTIMPAIALSIAIMLGCSPLFATPQEFSEKAKKELNAKPSKMAKKEAKALKKEGWTVTPGEPPLEKQLDKSYLMQYENNAYGEAKYIMGQGMSKGESHDAANIQALEIAKQNLASQIQTELTAEIETTIGNTQMSPDEVTSVVKTILASKSLIVQSIGRVEIVTATYRILPNKNYEVLVRLAYDSAKAKNAAKQIIRQEMLKKGDELHKKLQEKSGW